MPARSKSQQRLFGIVHAIQKGDVSPRRFSKKIREMAERIDPRDARDFAATKTKSLPDKKGNDCLKMAFVRGFLSRMSESSTSP